VDYSDLHWGDDPSRDTNMKVLCGPVRAEGEIRAISYVTSKDARPQIFRHAFERHRDDQEGRERYPYLLRADNSGDIEIDKRAVPPDSIAIGRLVDIELKDGQRVLGGLAWLVTDSSGEHVWIASPYGVDFAVEPREGGHHVTRHGIER